MWEREGECQVDIVDGDNAAEIAGGQRGLMMMLLASERANGRIERVARGQGHHCILRFTLCHQFTVLPLIPAAPSPLPTSSAPRPPHYPSFSNSGIPISRAASAVPLSRHLYSRISHHRPLNPLHGNVSLLMEYNPYVGYFFLCFHSKIIMGIAYSHDSFKSCKLLYV